MMKRNEERGTPKLPIKLPVIPPYSSRAQPIPVELVQSIKVKGSRQVG